MSGYGWMRPHAPSRLDMTLMAASEMFDYQASAPLFNDCSARSYDFCSFVRPPHAVTKGQPKGNCPSAKQRTIAKKT
jgi:hypothetical protein